MSIRISLPGVVTYYPGVTNLHPGVVTYLSPVKRLPTLQEHDLPTPFRQGVGLTYVWGELNTHLPLGW